MAGPRRGHVRLRDVRLPEHRHGASRGAGCCARSRRRASRGSDGDAGRAASPRVRRPGGDRRAADAEDANGAARDDAWTRPSPAVRDSSRRRSGSTARPEPTCWIAGRCCVSPARPPRPRRASSQRGDRHRLRHRPVDRRPVALHRRRQPFGLRTARRSAPPERDLIPMDARSIALLEFPLVRERSRPRRRSAVGAPRIGAEPSADLVIVARGLDETDQAQALLTERLGVGIGAAARHRAGRRAGGAEAGSMRHSSSRSPTRSSDRPTPDIDCRRSPAAASRARPRAPPAARGALHARSQLRSRRRAARHRVAAPRRAPRPSASPTTACAGGLTRWSARRGGALQEPIITLRNGRYVVPVKSEARSRVKGIVHDARQRGHAVRRADGGRRARKRPAGGPCSRAGGGRANPRRAVGAHRRKRRPAPRDARRARPLRLLGRQGEPRGRAGWRSRGDCRPTRAHAAQRSPSRADRPRRADRHPPRRRLRRSS